MRLVIYIPEYRQLVHAKMTTQTTGFTIAMLQMNRISSVTSGQSEMSWKADQISETTGTFSFIQQKFYNTITKQKKIHRHHHIIISRNPTPQTHPNTTSNIKILHLQNNTFPGYVLVLDVSSSMSVRRSILSVTTI